MTVYLRMPRLAAYHDKEQAFRYVFVGPEGTWSFLTAVDGRDLYRLQLVGLDEAKLAATDIPALVRRAMGCEVPYTIEDKSLWVRKRTVAERFAEGRVFLAGDAAHAHPTLDLFGPGFALLDFGGEETGAVAGAAESRRVPLAVRRIENAEAARLYERRLVLVRPDGHVAWRGDDVPADPVVVIDRVRGARLRA
jgi:hypothetical protein